MPKISVIVPVYNVEKYLDRCLKSLLNQTMKDIEIIVVNDGSTDKSEEIINKYIDKFKYLKKENGGLSSARNYGMKYANGEYIAFLDSDDYIEENMYQEMYNLAKKENADMVECDFLWEWENSKKIKYDKRRKYKNRNEMMKKPRSVVWNKIIKRKIIQENKINFPEGIIYEDLQFFYKIIPYIKKISYSNKYFVHYTQRKNSISNNQTEKNEDIFIILNNIIQFYKERNLYEKYQNELRYMCIRIMLGSSMKRILKIKDTKLRRKLILKTIVYLFKINNVKNTKELLKYKKNICFGITKLSIGGAERVLVDIVNELQNDYDITIFTIYAGGELEKEVNKSVKIVSMYNKELKNFFVSIYIFLFGKLIYNKYLRGKYDIDIAFLEGPITRIFSYEGNTKKIVWVHNDIKKVFGDSLKAKIKKTVDKYFYKKYQKIIFVSNQNKESFEAVYGKISNMQVIYNYINKNRVERMSRENIKSTINKCTFLTVSRLVKQKGIDRFIRIHKRLIDEGISHIVVVIGDGEEKQNLYVLAQKLNVENSFIFLGKKENPYPYIKLADYFTLLSYYEGYGMVIEEAKILNKPIIVTKTAALEAVRDYEKKLIIENDEEKIYEELKNVLTGKYDYLSNKKDEYIYDNKYLLDDIKKLIN